MTCSHQFIIPPPNGTTSIGVCRLCGEKREMFNYIDGTFGGWKGLPKDAEKEKPM